MARLSLSALFLVVTCVGCAAGDGVVDDDAGAVDAGVDLGFDAAHFVVDVVDVTYGDGAGFGQDVFPEVVMGPPYGLGDGQGSVDVLSLGIGGSITLQMGTAIVDDDGADFVVFENPFRFGAGVFTEAGQVSVSSDGDTWHTFACDVDTGEGCAGVTPVHLSLDDGNVDTAELSEDDGGDRFDLADVGVDAATYVRIVDVGGKNGAEGASGFDLDAVAVLHPAE